MRLNERYYQVTHPGGDIELGENVAVPLRPSGAIAAPAPSLISLDSIRRSIHMPPADFLRAAENRPEFSRERARGELTEIGARLNAERIPTLRQAASATTLAATTVGGCGSLFAGGMYGIVMGGRGLVNDVSSSTSWTAVSIAATGQLMGAAVIAPSRHLVRYARVAVARALATRREARFVEACLRRLSETPPAVEASAA